jgi:autotransporter-associated beta strand protein
MYMPVLDVGGGAAMNRHTRNSSSALRRRLLAIACGSAIAPLLSATAAAQSFPQMILDLRVAGTGAKVATVTTANATVNLELFALIADPNLNAADTGFNSTQGAWTSSFGGMLGNITTTISSPFGGNAASQNATPADIDGDGDLDVGANATGSSGFWIASNGGNGYFTSIGSEVIGGTTYRKFQLGTGTFTASSFNGTTAQLNYIARTGTALVKPHKYFNDSGSTLTSVNGGDSRLSVGAPINISMGGATYTWTRGAATSAWDTAGNWSPSAVPDNVFDTVQFGSTGVGNVTINGNKSIANILFTNSTGNYTLMNGAAGRLIMVGPSGGIIQKTGSGGASINATVPIDATTLTIDNSSTSAMTIGGIVTASTLTKSGFGTVIISGGGTNNIAGPTTVVGGTLQLQRSGRAIGDLVVQAGATVLWQTSNNQMSGSSATVLGGTLNLNGRQETLGALILGGPGAGQGATIQTGAGGILNLAGGVTYDATFNPSAATITGTVSLGSAVRTFSVGDSTAASDDVVVSAVVTSGAGSGLTKTGSGTLLLSGSNTYTGTTTINGGTVRVTGGAAIPDTSSVFFGTGSGNRLDLAGSSESVGSIAGTASDSEVAVGSGVLTVGGDNSPTTFAGTITGSGGALVKTGAGTLSLIGSMTNTISGVTTINAGTLRLAKSDGADAITGDVVINGGTLLWGANNQIADTAGLLLNSGGTINLNGFNETVASFTDSGGNVVLNGGNLFVSSGGDLTLNDGTTITGGVSLGGNLNYVGTTTTATISGGLSLEGTPLNHDFNISNGAAANDVVISGMITGTTGITKTGAGTLVYSGNGGNLNSGLTRVAAGTLLLDKTPGFGVNAINNALEITGGTVRLLNNDQINDATAIAIAFGGVFDANGFSDEVGSITGAGSIQTGGGEFAVIGATSSTFSGTIGGAGTFAYRGAGTLTLAGSNTLSGEISIEGGTVSASAPGSLGTADVILKAGTLRATSSFTVSNSVFTDTDGTIDVATGANLTLANDINALNSGTLIKTGGGTLTLADIELASYTGPTRIDAGTVVILGERNFSQFQPVTVNAGATLDLSGKSSNETTMSALSGGGSVLLGATELVVGKNAVTSTFAGQISGSGTLAVSRDGTLFLNGANSLGTAIATRGTLVLNGGSLAAAAEVSVDSNTATASSITISDGAIVNANSGFVRASAGSAAMTVTNASTLLNVAGSYYIGGGATGASANGGSLLISDNAQVQVANTLKAWASGTITLNGGSLRAGSLDTQGTPSRLAWTSGTLQIDSTLNIGDGSPFGTTTNIIGAGKTLVTGSVVVGANGSTSLGISGGATMRSAADQAVTFTIGQSSSIGVVTVSDAGSNLTLANLTLLTVGQNATGQNTLNVNNGGSVFANGNVVVASGTGNGAIIMSDAGSQFTTTQSLYVGGSTVASGGSGTLSISNGAAMLVAGTLKTWSSGSIAVTGGTIDATSLVLQGNATVGAGGAINVGAGGLTTNGASITLSPGANTPGVLALGGNVTYLASNTTASIASGVALPGNVKGTINLLSGNNTFNIGNGSQATDMTISARIINGGVIKTGAGTLALSGANDYSGPTQVDGGELFVTSGALPAASAVSVNNSAVLRLGGNTTIASLASAAAQPGSLELDTFTLSVGDETTKDFYGVVNGGKLIKEGTGVLNLLGNVNGSDIRVNRGTLRLSGSNPLLSGDILITGTGPTWGTLATNGSNLGTSTITLDGGHLLVEGTAVNTRAIAIEFGGGTLDIASGNVFTQSGVLSGDGGLTKVGAGTLLLNSVSTYAGQTFLSSGVFKIGVINAVPVESEIFMEAGAQLDLNSKNQTLASVTGDGTISLGSAALTVGGNDATTEYKGLISGSGSLTKNGTGAFTLSGGLSFSGGVLINAGTLVMDGTNGVAGGVTVKSNAAVSVDSDGHLGAPSNQITLDGGSFLANGSFTSSNPIDVTANGGSINVASGFDFMQAGLLSGSGALSKDGSGTAKLNSASSLSGAVAVNGGTLILAGAGSLQSATSFSVQTGATLKLDNSAGNSASRIGDTRSVSLAGGTLQLIGADGVTTSEAAGELALGAGSSSIKLQQGVTPNSGTELSFTSMTVVAGASIDFSLPGAGLTNKLLIANQPDGFLGGWATVDGADFAKYVAGEGIVPLSSGQYNPALVAGAFVRLSGSASTSNSLSIETLTLNATSPLTVTVAPATTLTIATGGLLKTGGSDATITGGSVASGNGRLDVRTSTGTLTIASDLTGAMNLSKSGAGVLELTAAGASHNFVGGIYLAGGSLRISSNANLGQSAGANNDLYFNGGTLATTAAVDFGAGRTLNFNGAGGALDLNGDASISTTNQLAGTGMLSKSGTGVLRISSANAFTAPVNVQQGNLRLQNINALGSATMSTPGENRSTITLQPGTQLDLQSDGPYPANFGNNIIVANNTDATKATITTGPVTTGLEAEEFKLGALNIGNARLATGGPSGTLEFSGIVTTTGAATIETGRDVIFADRVTGGGSLIKRGAGKLTLGSNDPTNNIFDTAANTYAGVTTIAEGILELNKAAGTIAIPGDISLTGGTLVLVQPRQIADNSKLLLSGGTFDVAQSDAIQTLNNSGANVIINNATLTVGASIISGGNTVVGGNGNRPGRGGIAVTSVTSKYVTESMKVSDGVITVNAGGSLEIGAGGLIFEGSASPTITLVSDSQTPGRMVLSGDVTNNCTAGTATIATSTQTPTIGTVELANAVRTFTVPSTGSNLLVTGRLSKGGLRKSGGGTLLLRAAGDYSLGTTIADGTIEARDGALGIGPVVLAGGFLNLRSDAAVSAFPNDLSASDSTLDIGRITGNSATGTMQMVRLSIGSARLKVTGSNAGTGTLEFTGPSTVSGTQIDPSFIDNIVAVTFSEAIGGAGYLTKDVGAGTLSFSGNAANTFTGTMRVNSGTLELNKPSGVTAVAGNLDLFTGGKALWKNNDQVADTATLTVNGLQSKADLGVNNDTVAAIVMNSGTISTTSGVLKVNGNITTAASTSIAKITGLLSIGDVTRTITVGNGTPLDDLEISAVISGTAGIIKSGTGTLLLSGNNTFTGGVTVQAGNLRTTGNTQLAGTSLLNVTGSMDLPGNFTTSPGTLITKTGAGSLTLRGVQSHGAGAKLLLQEGPVNLNSDPGTSAQRNLSIDATGGSVAVNASLHIASLNVGTGVTATMSTGGNKVIFTDTLSSAGTGKININDNFIVVTRGTLGAFDGTSYNGLTAKIASGLNAGNWNGPGIVTGLSSATTFRTTVGIASSTDVLGSGALWANETIPTGSILIRSTYSGDGNLDGVVNADDYALIDLNSTQAGASGFSKGDFNYDGRINADDYALIDSIAQQQLPPLGGGNFRAGRASGADEMAAADIMGSASEPPAGMTAVPEPASLSAIGLMSGLLLRRRRRAH